MRWEGIHEEDGKIDIEEDFDYEVIFDTKIHIQHFPPVYDWLILFFLIMN